MSTCGYYSPRFSEDIAFLPQWLQPHRHRSAAVGEHRKDSAAVSSPSCENCVFIGGPAQEQNSCLNTIENVASCSGFRLHLSGDEGTPTGTTPSNGNVTGDSIFNLLALADVETDKDDRPMYPQKILSVEVLWNPFDDIVPRQLKKTEPTAKADTEGKPKKKAVKQLNVLSFGDKVEEEENEAASSVKDKIKGIHDVLDDPRFLKGEAPDEQLI